MGDLIRLAGTPISLRVNSKFLKQINLIWVVQSFAQKYSAFKLSQISGFLPASRPIEGRLAIATNAGRDAVDARASSDERHSSGRQNRVVLAPRRWCQVLRKYSARRRWLKSPAHRGEHEISRKTIAQGMPGYSGEPVVTMLACFVLFSHARLRVHWASGIPCAL
jgi:hypothetical protein